MDSFVMPREVCKVASGICEVLFALSDWEKVDLLEATKDCPGATSDDLLSNVELIRLYDEPWMAYGTSARTKGRYYSLDVNSNDECLLALRIDKATGKIDGPQAFDLTKMGGLKLAFRFQRKQFFKDEK
jgi:hypothetical protein